jgi:crotonobetainyl-CoA:carnitine CoA-transferase CaiB-like acyl-CoA transferase
LALVTNIPGPLAAAALVADGARVVKVEPPQGDPLEAAAPAWYAAITRGMEVLRLDFRAEMEREQLHARVAENDLLITAMRRSALERLGLEWSNLHARHPALCHVAIVGEAAPQDDRPGHDLTYQAQGGLVQPPQMPRSVFADLFSAERAVAAAYRALLERAQTGSGVRAEISIAAGAAQLANPIRYGLTNADGPLGGAYALYGLYESRDGWIALAALEPHFQARLREALQLERLEAQALRECFAEQSSAYWEELARRFDLPLCAVANV